jgi:hypothetical protein
MDEEEGALRQEGEKQERVCSRVWRFHGSFDGELTQSGREVEDPWRKKASGGDGQLGFAGSMESFRRKSKKKKRKKKKKKREDGDREWMLDF